MSILRRAIQYALIPLVSAGFVGPYPVQAQVAVRIPDQDAQLRSRLFIGKKLWLATNKGAYLIDENSITRIIDGEERIDFINYINGQVWIATSKTLYQVEGETPKPVLDSDYPQNEDEPYESFFKDITGADGSLWVLTRRGVYKIDAGNAKQMSGQYSDIKRLYSVNEKLWVITSDGVYRVEGDVFTRIVDSTRSRRVYAGDRIGDIVEDTYGDIDFLAGKVWIRTSRNVYQVNGDTAKPLLDQDLQIYRLPKEINGKVWIATSKGAYRVDGDRVSRIPDKDSTVYDIKGTDSEVWIASTGGTYRVRGDTATEVLDQKVEVNQIWNLNGQVWLSGFSGIYRVDGDVPELILKVGQIFDPGYVRSIQKIDGRVWVMSERGGAYRIDGNSIRRIPVQEMEYEQPTKQRGFPIRRIPDQEMAFRHLENADGKAWLATSKGAYLVQGDSVRRIPDQDLDASDINFVKGKVWLVSTSGLYRVDENVTISVAVEGAESWWKSVADWILPGHVWIEGVIKPKVQYLDVSDGTDPYDNTIHRKFEIIMTTSKEVFLKAKEGKDYSPADSLERFLPSGKTTIYISTRDKWGNTIDHTVSGLVLPAPIALPFLLIPLSLILLFLVVTLAPFNSFFHSLLMNPFVRKYLSFGLVPLVMTVFPTVKWHVLRRYYLNVKDDEEFSRWQNRFVIPTQSFLPEEFGKLLAKHHKLLVIGQSGVGKTSYFKYLMACSASSKDNELKLRRVLPVFLPLERYREETIENMICAQLTKYGSLTDRDLATWVLQQGSFLVFIDGLNEVNDSMRNKINAFVDQHWRANYICISSQVNYPDFAKNIKATEMPPLGSEQIKKMIERRLGKEKADNLIGHFTKSTYDLYKIPWDLELAIDLAEQNEPLPQSKLELYEATMRPMFQTWNESGQADYPDLLFRRAYEMLSSQEAAFDRSDSALPDALRNRLLEKKYLVRSGDRCYFRHDLVRAYLASKYFAPRWKELLGSEKTTVDVNWRPMLEFVILQFEHNEEIRDLLLALLPKNKRLAGDLFNWVRNNQPDACQNWSDEFKQGFAEAMLRQNDA